MLRRRCEIFLASTRCADRPHGHTDLAGRADSVSRVRWQHQALLTRVLRWILFLANTRVRPSYNANKNV